MPVRLHTAWGFTLVELLVTVSIAAILLAMAAPSFSDLILNQRVRTGVSDLQTSLFFARSEAIKRAADISVSPSGGDWKSGWTVCVDANSNSLCNAGELVLRSQSALNSQLAMVSLPLGARIRYRQSGRLPPGPAAIIINAYVSDNPRVTERCVVVDLSGRPRVLVDTDGDPTNGCN